MNTKLIYLLLFLYLKGVSLLNSCEKQTTCHECVRDASACVWCASEKYDGIRCKPESSDQSWCPDSLENPKNTAQKSEEKAFSSDAGTVTQIKPQRYQLKLRPGQPLDFSFSFKGVKDYPVDLYFLFDASKSMTLVKSHTSQQSENIYKTMKSMTKDVFLGMGTFIDKNALPFTLNVTDNSAYSFRHRLSLTEDYKKFQEAVDATPPGQNRDIPEGCLDAIAQAIVCKKQIGWRNESRKILVLLTNGPFHAAGDGKSGGIFQPYDGKCYTTDGIYTKELEMDYPSVSMINKLARENEVSVIFAVSLNYDYVYQSLAGAISGSKKVILDVNKDGIVTTLKKIYEEITTKIKLNVNMRSGRRKNFDISFNPDCTQTDNSSACNVGSGKENNFNATIKLLEYDGNDKAEIDIAVEGINEKLALDIEVIRSCKCEIEIKTNSSHCNGEIWECGICKCGQKKYGDKCACVRNMDNKINDNSTCIGEGMKDPCSGSGTCFCGACQCREGFVGRYCECNINDCPLDKGIACGGRGECQCDHTCKCNLEWSGKACECYKSEEHCTGSNDKVCNERGICNCGSCQCSPIALWDSRKDQDKYCVINPCPECHNLQCKILTDCAICRINEYPDCPCSFAEYEIVEKLPEDILNGAENNTDWNVCSKVRVDVGCYTTFAYKYDEEQYRILLKLQRKKDCVESYYIFGGIFLLTLLLVGIFTLVAWKLLTEARDRKEYLKFVKDHEEDISGLCQNPLYEPASTTFKNPAFRKRSVNY